MKVILSIFLAIYIVYMLNYFKTTYSFAHPLTYFDNKYLYHPIVNSEHKKNMICKMGNDGAWIIALFLVLRFTLKKNNIKNCSKVVYLLILILSFLNLNAILYLIPYFILELVLIKYLL
jgi:hypothetical protein